MKVVSYSDVIEFWRVAGPLLAADPVRNTVPLSIVGRLRHGAVGSEPVLLTVHDGEDVVGAALCTPPAPIVLGAVPPHATQVIVDHLVGNDIRVPGADGIRPAVEALPPGYRRRQSRADPADRCAGPSS